jgi:hypothetical protein
MDYDIPKSETQCRAKLREEFLRHQHVTDIRVIDMLVIKVTLFYIYFVHFWQRSLSNAGSNGAERGRQEVETKGPHNALLERVPGPEADRLLVEIHCRSKLRKQTQHNAPTSIRNGSRNRVLPHRKINDDESEPGSFFILLLLPL